ncbi:MAG TPA: glutaminyl-peptide cyclotransferase [Terriglobales bacterium]
MVLKGMLWFCALCAALPLAAANPRFLRPPDRYQVVRAFPHDAEAFTQGLVYVDGHLYESTGLNGRSSLRMVDLQTGHVLQRHDLPAEYFGEGLTNWGSSLVQLTWKAGTALVYDRFQLRGAAHPALSGRRLGPDSGRQKPHSQRWDFSPPLPGPAHVSRDQAYLCGG